MTTWLRIALCFWMCAGTASAQGPAPRGPVTPPPAPLPAGAHALTAADLEAFLDGFMPLQIEHGNIGGAVIAVVKDGQVLFAKGYGYADVARKRPIVPESTLFRPGSISKLFTWTAVMQQVEQGKLDLDRDVNVYLDVKVPPAFGKPVTLRDIMTHRGGFEETIKHLFVGSAADLVPLRDYLPAHMPARIYPPGKVPAYSNYATTLAAYIVQRVSGQPFDAYIEQHIFTPLQMRHATFRQPLPAALASQMSNGYRLASDSAKPYEFVDVAPAGALAASAVDMAHFMIAHLQNGRFGDAVILQPATAEAMHARQQGWPDAMHAMALGFYEESRNGHRIIGHGGDTQWFHSDLHLIPDANVGFFVSYNSLGRDDVSPRTILFDKFMGRYFPSPPVAEPALASATADMRAVAGVYAGSRRFETNILSPLSLLGELTLRPDPRDTTLVVAEQKGLNGLPVHYREVAPMRFRAVGGHEQIAFTTDSTGREIAYLDFPFEMLQRVDHSLDVKTTNYWLVGGSLCIMVLTLLTWPVGAMVRRHYGASLPLDDDARRWRRRVQVVCLLCVAFVVTLITLASSLGSASGLGPSGDAKLHATQLLGVLCVLGALVAIYNSVRSWRTPGQWIWTKVWNTGLAVAGVGFAWTLIHWHLLNFHLNY